MWSGGLNALGWPGRVWLRPTNDWCRSFGDGPVSLGSNTYHALLEDPARIEREYQRRLKRESDTTDNHEHLQARIQKVKRGIARLVDAYEDGLLEKSDFEPRLRRARERLATLEAEVKKQADEESQRAELRLVIGQLQGFATRIQSGLHDADWSTKREIIRALVKRVEVDEAQVRVIYRIDPLPFDRGPELGCRQDCSRRVDAAVGVTAARKETHYRAPIPTDCQSLPPVGRERSRQWPLFLTQPISAS